MNDSTSKILAIMLYLVQLFINFKYGTSIAQVSNSLNLAITPSSWVFAIWIVIYSFQLYMLVGITDCEATKLFIPHAFSVLFNISWILAFTNMKLGLATVFILGLLASIVYVLINQNLNKIKIIKNFYSLYFGWISIASFISATGWIVNTLGIKFNQILAFIFYTIFIFSLSSFNLFEIIPYAIVYFDLIFVKKSLRLLNFFK
jgi:hypothetical protein